jgi:hypothetical protein
VTDRDLLISRKIEVRRQIEQTRRQLEQVRSAPKLNRRRVQKLEDRLDHLMSEEYRLRQAIDRCR